MWPFTALAETTWGFPIASALHVLGIAWFGGTVLARGEFSRLKRAGFAFMLLTGLALFLMQPVRYSHIVAFWIKLSLFLSQRVLYSHIVACWIKLALVAIAWRRSTILLWFAVVAASRFTAFL